MAHWTLNSPEIEKMQKSPGNSKTVVGIDPGFSGGLAKIVDRGRGLYDVSTAKMPFAKSSWPFPTIDTDALKAFIGDPVLVSAAFLERVSAMPQQGVTGVFRFGFQAGALQAFFNCHGVPVHSVPSAVWKSSFGLGRDKRDSILRAELSFPGASFASDGPAEAALIALFGITRFLNLKEKTK